MMFRILKWSSFRENDTTSEISTSNETISPSTIIETYPAER